MQQCLQNFSIKDKGEADGATCFQRVVKCSVIVPAQVASGPD
jgi:hypothetical protein